MFFVFLLSPPDPEQFDLDYIKETREIFHRNFFEQMIFHFFETRFRWPPAPISRPILLKIVRKTTNQAICDNNNENDDFFMSAALG